MKTLKVALVALAGFLFSTNAQAACEAQLSRLDKAKEDTVVAVYKTVVDCDTKVAKDNYFKAMQKAADSDTLIELSMVAINAEIWTPVWEMVGKISDYDARDTVAAGIGEKCSENEQVVKFLQGAYFGLRDIDFQQWDDALITCQSETFDAWLVQTVENPPPKQYDEKWDTVAASYIQRTGVDSLDALAKGAVVAAANGGPFEAILAHMDAAVTPGLGEDFDPAAQARLEAAYTGMAKELPPEQARSVADRLANSGSDAAAAALLPAIYPDRVKSDGSFEYAAVAVELADCDGVKSAVLHSAVIVEPGTRYQFKKEIEAPMRAVKPRLAKCSSEGDWVVLLEASPIGGKGDAEAFTSDLEKQYVGKGYEVKVREEKSIVLD